MGLFDFFKKKKRDPREVVRKLIDKYFGGYDALYKDVHELQEITKFDVPDEILSGLMIRCLGFIALNTGWTGLVERTLCNDCDNKVSAQNLKWLMVYVDLHYVHPNKGKEALLLFELGGRQIGMPAPTGSISEDYIFQKL